MAYSLTIVVACFNEAENIEASVFDLLKAYESFRWPFEILVVDDCSQDRSPEILRSLLPRVSNLRVITHPQNMGLGGAYRTGVQEAHGTHVMLFPGDNEINADSVRRVCDHIGEADIIASYGENPEIRPRKRQIISKLFTLAVNLLCLRRVKYYNGPVVHSRHFLSQVNLKTNSFAYQAEIMIQLLARGCTYIEIPFRLNYCSQRVRAVNSDNMLKILKTLMVLPLIYWRKTPPIDRSPAPVHADFAPVARHKAAR